MFKYKMSFLIISTELLMLAKQPSDYLFHLDSAIDYSIIM